MKDLHDYTRHNKTKLANSKLCGCCYCHSIMPASDVVEFVGKSCDTGLCPLCGVDAILPDCVSKITIEILIDIHQRWFAFNAKRDPATE